MERESIGMEITAHTICPGKAEGEAVLYEGLFSFLGDLDPNSGTVPAPHPKLEGVSLANKIFIFISGRGSTGGATSAWIAKRNGYTPAAIICLESEPVLSCAVIAAGIPTLDRPSKNPFELIKTGDFVKVDATEGIISF